MEYLLPSGPLRERRRGDIYALETNQVFVIYSCRASVSLKVTGKLCSGPYAVNGDVLLKASPYFETPQSQWDVACKWVYQHSSKSGSWRKTKPKQETLRSKFRQWEVKDVFKLGMQ